MPKRGGLVVMETTGCPVFVLLSDGVLYIQSTCCLCNITRGGGVGQWICADCGTHLRWTTKWVDRYNLRMHTRDGDLVEWLSFWTGFPASDLIVEVVWS